jgi:hypothetical protein
MRRQIVGAAGLIGLLAVPAYAQNRLVEQCSGDLLSYSPAGAEASLPPAERARLEQQVRILCGHATNTLTALQPAVGIAFSGGNPVLGTGTTFGTRLGFLPRVSVTGRANVALVEIPKLFDFDPGDGDLPALEAGYVPLPALQADVVVGVFNGLSLGFGSVDLLGSVAYFPRIEGAGMQDAILNLGGGARVGIVRQGLLLPGVSVSAMYRSMGDVQFGSLEAGDVGQFATNLRTFSLRGVVSKGLLFVDLAAGAGYDRYSGDVSLAARRCQSSSCAVSVTAAVPSTKLQTAAWNVFGNAGLSLLVLNLIAEVGYQKSLDVLTAAELRQGTGEDASFTELQGGKLFGSLGVRLTL